MLIKRYVERIGPGLGVIELPAGFDLSISGIVMFCARPSFPRMK